MGVLNTLQVRICLRVDTSMSGAPGPVGAATGPVVGCPKEDAGCLSVCCTGSFAQPYVCKLSVQVCSLDPGLLESSSWMAFSHTLLSK